NNANNNANGRVPNTRKVNGKPLSADITLSAGDVGASTPAQVNEAKNMATNAQKTANNAVNKADNAQRTANDGVSKANTAQTTANNANNNANGRVPNTRKVNGKPLNADITLNAGDVGALTQAQGDKRYLVSGTSSKLRLIWHKFVGNGAVVDITEDIRGKFALVATGNNVEIYALTYFPVMESVEVEVHRGSSAFCRLKITNAGRKLTINAHECGLYKILLLE
uniref:alanine-zipper protein n=1 Tax=Proteus faecis TaxID=2050967 RepID=UPI003075B8D1